jgi:hypothetical protein
VGFTLGLVDSGGATLSWIPSYQGHVSNVYRGEILPGAGPSAPDCLDAESISRFAIDPEPPAPGAVFYYVVTGRNSCGDGSAGQDSQGSERSGGWSSCATNGADYDGDGILDLEDNCPDASNADQADGDMDFAGDACDECPSDPSKAYQGECGCGVAEVDLDADGATDCVDNCPGIHNPGQQDADSDGIGDPCEHG